MSKYGKIYETEQVVGKLSTKFLFISRGNTDVIKAIEYQFIQPLGESQLFNLAFGDYDMQSGKLDDLINTNNGDHYVVFNTVLSTIPLFFLQNPFAVMMVQGSDNSKEFIDHCKVHCKKGCNSRCKNIDRRIKTYRYYVNKNYNSLVGDYEFFGGIMMKDGMIHVETYEVGKEYESGFCKKRLPLKNGN